MARPGQPERRRNLANHLVTSVSTTRRNVRLVACLLAVVTAFAAVLAPGAAAALPRNNVRAQQWWITRLDLRTAWKITEGKGITVAVIDSGVDSTFRDLGGAVGSGFGVGGGTAADGRRDIDPAYHGTLMADTIAGRGSGFGLLGVAPKATILPVSLNFDTGGGSADTVTVLNRLTAMADPPDVVNMSYGDNAPCAPQLQDAVTAATAKGMILVASAGNTPTGSIAPANCAGVVAVGAYDNDIRPWSDTAQQPYVALAGPGVKMIGYSTSAPSGYGYGYGTSDSAAVVSGSFALLKAKFPKASARDLVTRMLYTARQIQGAQGTRNSTWGFGAARPVHALQDTVPASAPNPIYDALDASSGGSSAPSTGTTAPTTTTSSSAAGSPNTGSPSTSSGISQAARENDGSSTGLIIGLIVAVLILALIIVLLVARSRHRTPAGPPPGPPGWG